MVFTLDGVNNVTEYLANESPTPPSHIGVGDDGTTATEDDSTLGNELQRNTVSSTASTSEQVTWATIYNSSQQIGQSFREAGLFNASSNGVMSVRFTHSIITKTNTTEVQYEITVKTSNA